MACASGSARWHGCAAVPKNWASERESRAWRPAREQPPRESDRVDDRAGEAGAGQPLGLAVEKGEVEARVVRDEHRVAGELEKTAHRDRGMRRTAQIGVAQAGDLRDHRPDGNAGIDEQLEVVHELEVVHAHRADLADARRARSQPGRLEVDDDEGRALERQVRAGRFRQPDGVSAPGQASVFADDFLEQAARHPDRGVAEREQPTRSLLDEDGPAPFLDELDQPVRGVQPELHAESLGEHTFAVQKRHYDYEWTDSDSKPN